MKDTANWLQAYYYDRISFRSQGLIPDAQEVAEAGVNSPEFQTIIGHVLSLTSLNLLIPHRSSFFTGLSLDPTEAHPDIAYFSHGYGRPYLEFDQTGLLQGATLDKTMPLNPVALVGLPILPEMLETALCSEMLAGGQLVVPRSFLEARWKETPNQENPEHVRANLIGYLKEVSGDVLKNTPRIQLGSRTVAFFSKYGTAKDYLQEMANLHV